MTNDEILAQVTFRPMQPADEPFIYSSWLKSFFASSDFAKHMTKTDFFANHHKVIGKILQRALVIIVHAVDEPSLILAYLVYEVVDDKTRVHYIYIKEAFRHEGIASHMLRSVSQGLNQLLVTHLTNTPSVIYARKKYAIVYNPYLM